VGKANDVDFKTLTIVLSGGLPGVCAVRGLDGGIIEKNVDLRNLSKDVVQHSVDLILIIEFCGDGDHRHTLFFEVGSEANRVFFAPAMQNNVATEIRKGYRYV
jgi:hypothetical protein